MKPDHQRLAVDRGDPDAALTPFARGGRRFAQRFQLRAIRFIGERENATAGGTHLLGEAESCDLAKRPDGAAIDHCLDRVGGILDQRDSEPVASRAKIKNPIG